MVLWIPRSSGFLSSLVSWQFFRFPGSLESSGLWIPMVLQILQIPGFLGFVGSLDSYGSVDSCAI